MIRGRILTLAAVGSLALTVTACADDSDDAPETVTQTVTQTQEETTGEPTSEESTTIVETPDPSPPQEEAPDPEPVPAEEPASGRGGPTPPPGGFVEQGEDCTGQEGEQSTNAGGRTMVCKDVGNATHWFVDGPGLHN